MGLVEPCSFSEHLKRFNDHFQSFGSTTLRRASLSQNNPFSYSWWNTETILYRRRTKSLYWTPYTLCSLEWSFSGSLQPGNTSERARQVSQTMGSRRPQVQRWKSVQTVQTRLCYFLPLAVLFFCLYTCKLATKHSVLLPLCYYCPFSTVLLALYY